MTWRDEYRSKLTTAERVARLVESGDHVVLPGCGAAPWSFLNALVARSDELAGVRICHASLWGDLPHLRPELHDRIVYKSFSLVTPNARALIDEGRAEFVPVGLADLPRLMLRGHLPVDVAVLSLTPPDEHGYCSYGSYVAYMKAAAESAKVRIAEINDQMPRTHGDTLVHVSEIEHLLEVSYPLTPIPPPKPPTETERQIGHHVADLVDDGSTLQLGRGGIPDAVLSYLRDKRDLGIHTEMFSDGVVDLVERGVITGGRKTLHPGKLVAGFLDGSERLYDFVRDNPMVEMRRSEYVNDPAVIGQNDNLVAINAALEIDLTGQINTESFATRLFAGVGGQLDFALGSQVGRNGRYVVALPSTASGGRVSRITAQFAAGTAVTIPRTLTHYVVTEHGIADLRGKTLAERAQALIAIAHPDFREELERSARERRDVFF
ncbi:MAG: acetyl-CoA hydrolase/transferase family protein [Chloroflexi bacterium]|nr:acetyl-CoA hydrolase/transferase family protein [Chloroflexota bacterium]